MDHFLEQVVGEDCAGVVIQFCVNNVLLRRAFGFLKKTQEINNMTTNLLRLDDYPEDVNKYLRYNYQFIGKPTINYVIEIHSIFMYENEFNGGPHWVHWDHSWNTVFKSLEMERPSLIAPPTVSLSAATSTYTRWQ
jgi:hypothetical protein